jgi:hypothetical protein
MFTQQTTANSGLMGPRRFIAVDLENVVGGAIPSDEAVTWAKGQIIEALGGLRTGDQIVLGTSHAGFVTTACTWTRQRYVVGSGLNGADLALLDVLDENIAARFVEVVVISGDGIFSTKVAQIAAAGAHVTVVAHLDKLSAKLRLAANSVTALPEHCYPTPYGTPPEFAA